jgi:hemerythrin superfamily protein
MHSAASHNALSIFRQDHRNLKDLFMAFDESDDLSEQQDILTTLVKELTLHVESAGRIFFPAIKATSWAGHLVAQAEEAHEDIQTVLEDLQEMDVEDPLFSDKVVELEDKVLEHIRDIEAELLLQAEHSDQDWEQIGQSLQKLKDELLQGSKI